jgi:pimeloyl-ACP methyl ester carboxylesterase
VAHADRVAGEAVTNRMEKMMIKSSEWFRRVAGHAAMTALLAGLLAGAAAAQEAPKAPVAAPDARAIIADARRIMAPRGIEENYAVEIGGIKQWISVRGRDRRNPILLFIHGGPATTEMPVSWLYQSPWEDFFTVVQWDQRGAGKSWTANEDPAAIAEGISIERMTQDGVELVDYLRKKYDKRKIFVLGHSWGTVIGLNVALRHPDWLHAYIGMGQVINGQENEELGYAFALREARRTKNAQAIKELEAIAPYPNPSAPTFFEQVLTQRKWVIYFGGLTAGRSDFSYDTNARLLAPEYSDADLAAARYAGLSLVALIPGLTQLDYRKVHRLDTPLFIVAGRRDFETPSALAADWFSSVQAPYKRLFWFEHSAHMMQLEQPGKLLMHLVNDVRPIAAKAGDVAPADAPGVD